MYSTLGLDQGVAGTRVMLRVDGVCMFCRAVPGGAAGTTPSPSTLPVACVHFAPTAAVDDPAYLSGQLGTWGALAGSRRLAIQSPQQRTVAGIKDIGLPAGAAAGGGFVPGWYGAAFWRVVGTYPQLYAAGGVVGSDYLYSTRFLDQGVAGTRVVAAVVGYGSMYCRGVGADADPVVACVQFDDDCSVAAEYALYQSLGRWSNYSAKAASLFSL